MTRHWTIERGAGPLLAVALHAGHAVDAEVLQHMAIDEADRLREEDPYTDGWAVVGDARVVVHGSRFQLDLNRPRASAIYAGPEQAWGLDVWRAPLPDALRARVLARHDAFHAQMTTLIEALRTRHGRVCVLDLHSYCHRRGGPDAPFDDPAANPMINLCTEPIDRARWGHLVDGLVDDLRACSLDGEPLDVRENVKFTGGTFMTWVNRTFAPDVCAVQIEVKKVFMDEWSGALDADRHRQIGEALAAAMPGIRAALAR